MQTCHPKERAVFKAHVVSPIEPITSRECETHEDQQLAFFCTQCGVPVSNHVICARAVLWASKGANWTRQCRCVHACVCADVMQHVFVRACTYKDETEKSLRCAPVQVCAHCLLMGAHIEHPRVSLHSAVLERKDALSETIEALKIKRCSLSAYLSALVISMIFRTHWCGFLQRCVAASGSSQRSFDAFAVGALSLPPFLLASKCCVFICFSPCFPQSRSPALPFFAPHLFMYFLSPSLLRQIFLTDLPLLSLYLRASTRQLNFNLYSYVHSRLHLGLH